MRLLERLKEAGYIVALRDDGHLEYSLEAGKTPTEAAAQLLSELRDKKSLVLSFLKAKWPPESADCERKFRPGPPRLYPLINKRVRTPLGDGVLLQVGDSYANVLLDVNTCKARRTMTQVDWAEIWPIGE